MEQPERIYEDSIRLGGMGHYCILYEYTYAVVCMDCFTWIVKIGIILGHKTVGVED